jgi:hypothetical protein
LVCRAPGDAEGELAIVPNTGHVITPPLVELMIEFFERSS